MLIEKHISDLINIGLQQLLVSYWKQEQKRKKNYIVVGNATCIIKEGVSVDTSLTYLLI